MLAVIALGLLAWFYSLNQEDDGLNALVKVADAPEYVGQKMNTVVYAPLTGKKQCDGHIRQQRSHLRRAYEFL